MKRVLISLAVAGALLAGAFALGLDPVTIKRTAKAGDTFNYDLSAKMTVNGQDGDVTAKIKHVVKTVGDDGGLTIEQTTSDITYNGMDVNASADPTVVKTKANGEITDFSMPDQMGPGLRYANLLQFFYPPNPINVGDSWTVKTPANEKLGAVEVNADFKLVGEEKIGNFDTYKVEATKKEAGTDPGSIHGFFWLNKDDGSMVKADLDLTNVTLAFGSSSGKTTLTRIP
ncbi:MAG TPA: hypothetical protein VG944_15535 [Fimbriimonas sp.]|nr:hypothetical protein [Fimbriimonas sp.]